MKTTVRTVLFLALGLNVGACALEDGEVDESTELAISNDLDGEDVTGDLDGRFVATAQSCVGTTCSQTVSNGHGTTFVKIIGTVSGSDLTRKPYVTDNCSGALGSQWRIVIFGNTVTASGLMANCGTGQVGNPVGYKNIATRVEIFNTSTSAWVLAVSE